MRKSSLGRRSSSTTSTLRRTSSFGQGDVSNRRSDHVSKLLKPGFTSRTNRSTSEDRETTVRSRSTSNLQPPSTMKRSLSVTQLPTSTVKRHQSYNPGLNRGMMTPSTPHTSNFHFNLPSGSISVRSKASSIGSSRASSMGMKQTRKDPRPITEKAFQSAALSRVQSYFQRLPNATSLTDNQMSLRPMNLQLFLKLINHLISKIDSRSINKENGITKHNYTDKLPQIMKELQYWGKVDRSWLLTVNVPRAWHSVVALLDWLVEVVQAVDNLDPLELMYPDAMDLPHDVDDIKDIDFQKVTPYLISIYPGDVKYQQYTQVCDTPESELKRQLEAEWDQFDAQFNEQYRAALNIREDEMEELEKEVAALEAKRIDPMAIQARAEFQENLERYHADQKQLNDQKDYIRKCDEYLESLDGQIQQFISESEAIKKNIEHRQREFEKLHQQVSNQKISFKDKEKFISERMALLRKIDENEKVIDDYSGVVYTKEVQIIGINKKVAQLVLEYNKLIAVNSATEDELRDAAVDHDVLRKGAEEAMINVDEQLHRLKARYKQKLRDQDSQLQLSHTEINKVKDELDRNLFEGERCKAVYENLEFEFKKEKKTLHEAEEKLRYEVSECSLKVQALSESLSEQHKTAQKQETLLHNTTMEDEGRKEDVLTLMKTAKYYFTERAKIWDEQRASVENRLKEVYENINRMLDNHKTAMEKIAENNKKIAEDTDSE